MLAAARARGRAARCRSAALSVRSFSIGTAAPQAIATIDAFCMQARGDLAPIPFSGNPAAVCFLGDVGTAPEPSVEWMRNVAAEMNLSETAFLRRTAPGHFLLRWFTPTDEVDLCGHATLASSHALWEAGHADESQPIRFETLSGTLIASRADDDGSIQLDFPSEAATAVILQDADSSPAEEEAMRLLRDGLGLHAPGQILSVTRNRMDILAEVTPDAFKQQELDFGILGKLANCRVLSVTTKADLEQTGFDFSSRSYAPAVGVDEDPVCGSAHCFLGPHWAARLGKTKLLAHAASRRGGVVGVSVGEKRVALQGKAITTLNGILAQPVT